MRDVPLTEGLGASLHASETAPKQKAIDRDVDRQDDCCEDKLNMACETRRVDYGQQVALDKAFRVATLAGQRAEVVFKPGQRTQPPGDLYKDAPSSSR